MMPVVGVHVRFKDEKIGTVPLMGLSPWDKYSFLLHHPTGPVVPMRKFWERNIFRPEKTPISKVGCVFPMVI